MEESQHLKTIFAIIAIGVILVLGYFLLIKNKGSLSIKPSGSSEQETKPMNVVVENTPVVGGALSAPRGFPQEIPFEQKGLVESAITYFPDQGAQQFSLSYNSSKSVATKYTEYKKYMQKAGYSITEGKSTTSTKSIYGVKAEANLSVVISNVSGKTLVQLSYLLK